MGLRINTNMAAVSGRRNIEKTDRALNKALERLSSGLRINRAADDPAGLAVAERQRAQIAGLNQAIENAERATSLVQTAEGALDEVNNILVHMRELAIDSANVGVNDANALAANQAEIDNALATLDRVARDTEFGTKKLLDGSAANSVSLADGANTTIYSSFSNSTLDTGTYSLQLSSVTDARWAAQNTTTSQAMGISGNLAGASQDVKGLTAGAHTVKVTQASAAAAITGDVVLADYTGDVQKFKLSVKDADGNTDTSADLSIDADVSGGIAALVTDIQEAIDADATIGKDTGGDTVSRVEVYAVDADTIGFRSTAQGSDSYIAIASPGAGTDATAGTEALEGFTNGDSGTGTDGIMELDGFSTTVSFIEGSDMEAATTVTLSDGDDGQIKFASRIDQTTDALRGLNLGNVVVNVTAASGTATVYDSDGGSGGSGNAGTAVSFTADEAFTIGDDGGNSMSVTIGNQILLEGTAASGSYEDLTVVDNALTFQVGGGRNQTVELSLLDVGSDTLAVGLTNTSSFANLSEIQVGTAQEATDAMLLIDQAISEVTDVRASIGSFQANTLESQLSNLRVASENMTSARSTLVDADFAVETSQYTKQQILMQTGITILKSAGQMPQMVLSLLQ